MQAGADIDAEDTYEGMKALDYAVSIDCSYFVGFLIENDANLETRDKDNHATPLMYAARYGCMNVIELLLAAGASTEARDNMGQTALHYAATRRQLGPMRSLLEYNAVIDVPNDTQHTPLMIACSNAYAEIFELLLENGANENIPPSVRSHCRQSS